MDQKRIENQILNQPRHYDYILRKTSNLKTIISDLRTELEIIPVTTTARQEELARIKKKFGREWDEKIPELARALELSLAHCVENFLWFGGSEYYTQLSDKSDDVCSCYDFSVSFFGENGKLEALLLVDATTVKGESEYNHKVEQKKTNSLDRRKKTHSVLDQTKERQVILDDFSKEVPIVINIKGSSLEYFLVQVGDYLNAKKNLKYSHEDEKVDNRKILRGKETALQNSLIKKLFLLKVVESLEDLEGYLGIQEFSKPQEADLIKKKGEALEYILRAAKTEIEKIEESK